MAEGLAVVRKKAAARVPRGWESVRTLLSRQEGFTLIEMLAVILIIGILVAVATISVPRFLADARKSGLKQTIAAVQVAAERFYHNHAEKRYPVGKSFANEVALAIDVE